MAQQPYHAFVQSLIDCGYSNLKFFNRDVLNNRFNYEAKCTLIRFNDANQIAETRDVSNTDFDAHEAGKYRRLFILEGESSAIIDRIGQSLDVEPEFFAEHIRAVTWEHHDDKTNNMMLPSVR